MTPTTPAQARELADFSETVLSSVVLASTLRSLADQLEAAQAELHAERDEIELKSIAANSMRESMVQLESERDKWKDRVECVVDIYFDGTEAPEEHRAYVDGAFPALMNELRAAIAKGTA